MWWLKNKEKAVMESRQNAICVVCSSKPHRESSRDQNLTALKAISLLVYKAQGGVKANSLISTARALQSKLSGFLVVTQTVSQFRVFAQKSARIYQALDFGCIWRKKCLCTSRIPGSSAMLRMCFQRDHQEYLAHKKVLNFCLDPHLPLFSLYRGHC